MRVDHPRWKDRIDRRAALIVGVYLVVAVAWILGSDWLAARIAGGDPGLYARIQSMKGIAFVATLAAGLYLAIAWANAREWHLALAKRELEETLMVSQRLEALGTLAGTVVHDFNNVIAVIRGTTTLIELEGKASDGVLARLRQIEQAAGQAEQLVRQLQLFMRNAPVAFETADLREVLKALAPILERAAGRDISLQVDPAGLGLPVQLVRSQVESTILNLVVNARDALADRQEKRIRLSAGRRKLDRHVSRERPSPATGHYVTLTVADNGCGIPREQQVRIFSPFYTTKPAGRGTGLGLASVLRVMQTHGGWVEVESEPGCGAAFTLFFPAAPSGASLSRPATPAP